MPTRNEARNKRLKRETRYRTLYTFAVQQFGRCALCGGPLPEDPAAAHLDHKIPLAHGGPDNRDNLQATCAECNIAKGANLIPAGGLA